MRGLSSVLLVLGITSAMIAACGGQSGKKSGPPSNEGGESDVPGGEAGGAGESGRAGSRVNSGGGGGSGGTNATPAGGFAGVVGVGGVLTTAGAGGGRPAGGVGGTPPNAGGATLAGSPSMTSAGMANVPTEAEPPPGCTPSNHFATTTTCEFQFQCEEGRSYYYAGCNRIPSDGSWSCRCKGAPIDQHTTVHGAEGMDACNAVAAVCAKGKPEEEPSCELVNKSINANNACSLSETCGWEIELESGVTVQIVRDNAVSCSLYESGEYYCQCSAQATFGELVASAPSTDELCESVVEYCRTGETPEFTGPEKCVEQSVSVNGGGCDASNACSQSADIGNGITLMMPVPRSGSCSPPVNGVSRCYCAADGKSFNYDAKLTSVDRNACLTAISSCSPATKIEGTGPVTCKAASEFSTQLSCNTELDCTQAVTIGGTGEYTGHGRMVVACRRAASGDPWDCSCASGEDTASFQLENAGGGWDVCPDAVTHCEQEIEVYIGPSSELGVLPP